ncbi:MAG: hypothetical protein EOM69_07880, partial [Clostridia bacterium]|nr:hypothetical protein [Clostridia bacterium]
VMVEDGVDSGDPTPTPLGYYQKLTRGSTGARVKQVQQRLTELGFFDGPISGNYMNQTVAAVKKFQEHNGMEADGVTGEETWNLLFDSAEVRSAEASPCPTPEPTPVPYAVTVDVQNQAVLVYGRDENGGYTVPVRRMVCSTGMKGSDSDVGEWVLNGRTARWAFFSLYGSHAQYWTRINSAIAFHSVIYRSVDNMALSVKSYNLLGSRASHGCIRLLVSDAKWIYDNLGEGTVVTITEDIPNDPELRSAIKPPALNRGNMLPYSTPEPTAEPAYSATALPPQPFRQLKRNSEGEDVYWLQRKLKDMGFYTGTATGVFLSGTEKAVKAFQKENGMSADGVAGEETLQAIYADVLHPVVTITPPRVSVSPSAAVTPSPTVAPLPSPSQKP